MSHPASQVRDVDVLAGDSPEDAAVPFWVTACVRLDPPRIRRGREMKDVGASADKVLTAAQVLIADRVKAHGDAAVTLDREAIALTCGYTRIDKIGWILDYLVSIQFLRIERHHKGVGKGRRPDTFVVFKRPPAAYVGPRTYAEMIHRLRHPDQDANRVLFVAPIGKPAGQTEDPQVRELVGKPAGQTEDPHVREFRADQDPQVRELVGKPAGQTEDPHVRVFPERRREGTLSESSLSPDRSKDAAATGPASPAAASQAAVDLIAGLAWTKLARPQGAVLDSLAVKVDVAADEGGLSHVQLTRYLAGKLREVRKQRAAASYLSHALDPDQLPMPADLPQGPQVEESSSAAGSPAPPELPACDECGAEAGTRLAPRVVENPDGGRDLPCPSCRPAGNHQAA